MKRRIEQIPIGERICFRCKKEFTLTRNLVDVLINKEQDPKVKYFCSEECKLKWIYKNQRRLL